MNWKTIGAALFSLLATLAIAADQLGELAPLLPPDWRARVILVSAAAAFVLRIWKAARDQAPPPPPPPPQA